MNTSDGKYTGVVEEIKNRLDIVDVISKFVVLKKSGHNYMGLCPFHNEKTPSFTVTPSRQIFKCFGCGEGGDVISFLMKINNQSFMEVIKEQAVNLGIELPDSFGQKSDNKEFKEEKERLKNSVYDAMEFYHNNLLNNDGALEYLEKRGVGEIAIGKFFLGLAPNSNFELKNHLRNLGYTNDELYKAGLLYEKNGEYIDRFKNRIIIPIFDVNSKPVAFGARAILPNQNPKYLNSPESVIYNKSSILFGLNTAKDAIREEDSVIIMEGYFDVISAQISGVKNAVASCGTALTPQHIKLLSRYTMSRKIYLAFDADGAGRKATKSGALVIKEIFKGLGEIKQTDISYAKESENVCEIRVVEQFGGKDPDEYIREFGAESYKEQIKNAPLLLDYELDSLLKNCTKDTSPQEKSILVQQIVDILKEIQNPVILSDYIRKVSFRINVEETLLKEQVKLKADENYFATDFSNVVSFSRKNRPSGMEKRYISLESKIVELGLRANSKEKVMNFLDKTENYIAKDNLNALYIKEIREILTNDTINSADLAKKLFSRFYNEADTSKKLTDLVYESGEYELITSEDYAYSLVEIFNRLKSLEKKIKIEALKTKYNSPDISEEEKIKVSMQIIEQVKQ